MKKATASLTSWLLNGALSTLIKSRVIASASTTTSVRNEPCTANEPPVRNGPKFIRTPYV